MVGIEDPAGAGRPGRVDRRAIQADRLLAGGAGRHDEHPRRPLEGVGEARGVVEIAPADAALLQSSRLLRIADAHPDLLGGNAFEQPLRDHPAELTVGSGDDDHDDL